MGRDDDTLWYRDGLHFECTRCGNCCGGGTPGYVWVDEDEIQRLARRLGLSGAELRRRYTRHVPGWGRSLTEKEDFDCIFYDRSQGCTVYEDRPRQCRTWPFWNRVLASRRTWEIEAESCPGMDQGRHFDLVRIERLRRDDGIARHEAGRFENSRFANTARRIRE